jgi:hypothetical protein
MPESAWMVELEEGSKSCPSSVATVAPCAVVAPPTAAWRAEGRRGTALARGTKCLGGERQGTEKASKVGSTAVPPKELPSVVCTTSTWVASASLYNGKGVWDLHRQQMTFGS